MPGGDRTGPQGMGPMTGRGLGYCTGYNSPGYANPGPRRFFGRGFGRGFGWRRWNIPVERVVPVYPTQPQQPTKEQEVTMLENDAKTVETEQKALNQELEAIKKRIEELKNKQQ